MAIGWRCHSLEVENFRGLQKVQLVFPDRAPTVIIGANNAGKSSVLDALAMCLGGPSFFNYAVDTYDFFHDAQGVAAERFDVSITFRPGSGMELPAVRGGIGNPIPVSGACVSGSRRRDGELAHEIRLLDSAKGKILLQSGVPLKGQAKDDWKEHNLSYKQRYARWMDIADHRAEVWHLKPGNLFVSLYQWKTGPLHKLAALLANQFFKTEWHFEYHDRQHAMPSSLTKAHSFFTAAVQSLPFWQQDLKPKLQETLSLYLGRQARIELKPDISSIEDWLAQQLALSFASDAGGAATPLVRMGDGWQSLVRIAALDVLSQYPEETRGHVVLLFEEPESFLHPHLARKFRGVLERLADGGWTVVVTTHSPSLVSFAGNQHITRLTRAAEVVEHRTLRVQEMDSATKFQERLDERGAHEMLFAQKAVLCEGQDDVYALRSYLLDRCDLDLDGKGVSLIRTGDVGQLAGFAGMAKRLGIPWCAVSDQDLMPDGSTKPATEKIRQRLEHMKTPADLQTFWPQDLEACLGRSQGKATPEWQVQNIESVVSKDLDNRHPHYVAVCKQVRAWIES